MYAYVVLKYATDFGFSKFPVLMRMKANFNMQNSETLDLRRMSYIFIRNTQSIEFFALCTKLTEMAILYSKDLTTAKKKVTFQ